MRWSVIAVVAAACGAPPAPATPAPVPVAPVREETVRIAYKVPAVGASATEDRRTELVMTIHAPDGKDVPMTRSIHERRRVEVLARDRERVTRARYTFEANETKDVVAGAARPKPSLIEGKTYTLEIGNPTVVTTDGGPAPADEAAEVRDEVRRFGKPDRIGKLLSGRTYRKDVLFELPVAEVPDIWDDATLSRMALTYRRTDGDVAVFDMIMVITGGHGGITTESSLTGEVTIDPRSGEAITMSAKGPVKYGGTFRADGTIAITWTLLR